MNSLRSRSRCCEMMIFKVIFKHCVQGEGEVHFHPLDSRILYGCSTCLAGMMYKCTFTATTSSLL